VAGGIRGPPKNIIMPFLPPSLLHTVFVDAMRLPLSGHPFLSTRMPASEFLKADKVPAIAAGAAPSTRSRSDAARITGYRWLLVCIDGFSKFVFIQEIQQKAELDVNNKFLQPLDVKSYRGRLVLAMAAPDKDDELQSNVVALPRSFGTPSELLRNTSPLTTTTMSCKATLWLCHVVALPRSFGTPSELLRNYFGTRRRRAHARFTSAVGSNLPWFLGVYSHDGEGPRGVCHKA